MLNKSRVFMSGRSQRVTIPAAFRFRSSVVSIRRDAQTDDVILSGIPPLADVFAALDAAQLRPTFWARLTATKGQPKTFRLLGHSSHDLIEASRRQSCVSTPTCMRRATRSSGMQPCECPSGFQRPRKPLLTSANNPNVTDSWPEWPHLAGKLGGHTLPRLPFEYRPPAKQQQTTTADNGDGGRLT